MDGRLHQWKMSKERRYRVLLCQYWSSAIRNMMQVIPEGSTLCIWPPLRCGVMIQSFGWHARVLYSCRDSNQASTFTPPWRLGVGGMSDMFVCAASSAKVKRIAFVRTVFHLSIVWWRAASNDIHALETASWSIDSNRGPPRYAAVSLLSTVDKLWYFHGWASHKDYQLWNRQTWPKIMAMHNLMFKTAQFGSLINSPKKQPTSGHQPATMFFTTSW